MIRNELCILCFFLLLSSCNTSSPVSDDATTDPDSTIVVNPQDLTEEQLNQATKITESTLGTAPTSTHLRRITYIPNGNSWNIFLPYSKEYVSPGTIITFNVDEQQPLITTMGYIPPYKQTPHDPDYDIDFSPRLQAKRFIYKDKMVHPLQTKYQKDIIMTYDIASNSFEDPLVIPHDDFKMLVADANHEGLIRASGYSSDQKNLWCYEYNPFTGELTMSEKYPIRYEGLSDYCYGMTRAVGDWIVVGWGANPWTLMAYNFRTRTWKKLRETPGQGSYKTFRLFKQKNQTILIYTQDVFNDTTTNKYWRFVDGELEPTDLGEKDQYDSLDMHPLQEKYDYLGTESQLYIHPDISLRELSEPPLKIDDDSVLPQTDGSITINFIYGGANETVRAQIEPFKTRFQMIGHAGDYLYGSADTYGQHIFYNTRTGKTHIFDGTGISVYAMNTIGDRVYAVGYPNFCLREYNLRTMEYQDLGPNHDVLTHRPMAGIEEGIDGKVYYSGEYYRTRIGGGLAWYDPTSGEYSGLPIETYRPFWMTKINNGTHMILSSKYEGGCGLAIYDVLSGSLEMKIPDTLYTGQIVGYKNHVIGYGLNKEDEPIIYRMDPLTMEMIWQFKVPHPPVNAVAEIRKKHFVCTSDGADGVYFAINRTLIKVNANTAEVTIVGNLSETWNIIDVKGTLYQAGKEGFSQLQL